MELRQVSGPGYSTSTLTLDKPKRKPQAPQRRRQEALAAIIASGDRGLTSGEAGAQWIVALSSKVADLVAAGEPISKTREQGGVVRYRWEGDK